MRNEGVSGKRVRAEIENKRRDTQPMADHEQDRATATSNMQRYLKRIAFPLAASGLPHERTWWWLPSDVEVCAYLVV